MHFNILSPVQGLEEFAILSRHHLVLAQIKDPTYRQFYKLRREKGDHIILDNGAWEGNQNWAVLTEAIVFYNPNVVVLPDYLLQPWEKTLHSAQVFLDTFNDEFPDVDWAFCPQASRGDIMGWIEGLVRGLEDSRINWICLPRALATDISTDPLMRANVCRFVKHRGRRVHALGMLGGNVGELAFLRDAGCDSIDSNAPVFRGWYGVRLGQIMPSQNTPYSYTVVPPLTEKNHQIILQNLEDCCVNTRGARAVRTGT